MTKRDFAVIGLWVGMLVLVSANQAAPLIASASYGEQASSRWVKLAEEQPYILHLENGKLSCRTATAQEIQSQAESTSRLQAEASPRQNLTVQGTGNITFVLRAGAGLQASSQAQEGYLRALQIWSSLIEAPSPVTIVFDADYGPTVFGSTVPGGQARPQLLIGSGEYEDWRQAVTANANSGKDLALFNALPEAVIPTDLGDTDTFALPSMVLRVIGLIPPVADPDGELAQFGAPPAVAIRSTLPWDFNPDDGIDQGTFDFVGTAVHEIGHMIGFFSQVGVRETNPNAPLAVTGLDLYRFRPGTTMETFTNAKRILSAGGEHSHYAGEKEIPQSTARAGGVGGDGFTAAHWKDDSFTGIRLGVMDPQPQLGEKMAVSNNDLIALKAMGYRIVGEAADHSPYSGRLKGDLQGDSLTLTGAVYDIDADVSTVQITLLDSFGNTLRENAAVAFGNSEKVSDFTLNLVGLNELPGAVQAKVLFTDSGGNSGVPVIVGFGLAEAGAPTINDVTFTGSKLILKGKDFAGQLQVEINGVMVATVDVESNKKVKIKGDTNNFNIRTGANRVRVIKNSKRSNIAILVF